MNKLIVVRHGQTDFNIEFRFTGSIDIPINKEGINQARTLAETLKDERIDCIYSSSLIRARQTVSVLNEYHHKDIQFRDELKELYMGVFQGLTKPEVIMKYPAMWEKKKPRGSETYEQAEERVLKIINEIGVKYKNKNILIVTHGLISKVIYKIIENPSSEEFKNFLPKNCTPMYYYY